MKTLLLTTKLFIQAFQINSKNLYDSIIKQIKNNRLNKFTQNT